VKVSLTDLTVLDTVSPISLPTSETFFDVFESPSEISPPTEDAPSFTYSAVVDSLNGLVASLTLSATFSPKSLDWKLITQMDLIENLLMCFAIKSTAFSFR
jgi:hypothetical protein